MTEKGATYGNIEIISRIYLEDIEDNEASYNVLTENVWIRQSESLLSDFKSEKNIRNLIEIEKDYWLMLYIEYDNECNSYSAYYIDPCGIKSFENIKSLLKIKQFKFISIEWLKTKEFRDSWKYSLYSARYFLPSSYALLENDSQINSFVDEITEAQKQLTKMIEKIETCSDIFGNTLQENIPVISDFKIALLFIYFIEALALEDKAFSNIKLKQYIKNIVGVESIDVVKNIRCWFLHRKESYIIFPQQIHKFNFSEANCKSTVQDLYSVLLHILDNLQGKICSHIEKKFNDVIKYSDKLGNYIENKEIKNSLNDYSHRFIKDSFSIKNVKNPQKTMFNFIVNFVPLLQILNGNKMEPYQSITSLRSQLVHNIYILYQANSDLPFICFHRNLQNLKEMLLVFNLTNSISKEIQIFPQDEKSTELFKRLNICYDTFAKEYADEICSNKIRVKISSNKEKISYLIEIIEYYLKSLALIDVSNDISITNISINSFGLPTNYNRFTNSQRKVIFELFAILKNIHDAQILSNYKYEMLENNIKYNIISVGLNKKDFEIIRKSLLNPNEILDKDLVKSILKQIMTIFDMQKYSGMNIASVIKDYFQILHNKSSVNNYHKWIIRSIKIENKIFEIKIANKSIDMCLHTIIKNIILLIFDTTDKDIMIHSLEQTLNDDRFLKFLSNEKFNTTALISHIKSIPSLVPLGTKLLCNRDLKLSAEEEISFIKDCMKALLYSPNETNHLLDLFSFKSKNRAFDILTECYQMLEKDLENIELSRINIIFSSKEFQSKIMKIIKSDSLVKGTNHEKIAIHFLNFKYTTSKNNYHLKNYQDSFSDLDGKTGLSVILKELLRKKIITNSLTVIKMNFFIAQVNNRIGIIEKDETASEKFHFEALRILDGILIENTEMFPKWKMPWLLKIKAFKAYTCHLLKDFSNSLFIYREIYSALINSSKKKNRLIDIETHTFLRFKTLIKSLIKSKGYKFAIHLYSRDLNILKIMNSINFELYHLARSTKDTEKSNAYYIEAIQDLWRVHLIQREILGKDDYLPNFSLELLGKMTLKLKNISQHLDIYNKSAALHIGFKGKKSHSKQWRIRKQFKLILKAIRKIETKHIS